MTVTPEDLDAAMTAGAGWPMGPCALVDLIGIDLHVRASTALFERLPDLSRNQLASDVVAGLLAMLADFERASFGAWRDAWNERHAYAGLPIRVIQGQQTSNAIAGEVDESGNLWVTENGHSRRLAGGEISVRRRL